MADSSRIISAERNKVQMRDEGDSMAALSMGMGHRTGEPMVLLEAHRRMMKRDAPGGKAPGRGRLFGTGGSTEIGDQIGKELRGLYDDIVAQPVPDRFLDLLNQLEAGAISSDAGLKSPGER